MSYSTPKSTGPIWSLSSAERRNLPSSFARLGLPPRPVTRRKALPPPEVYVTETRESILSLLIKIHNRLSAALPLGGANSTQKSAAATAASNTTNYSPPTYPEVSLGPSDPATPKTARIGDGPFFIRKVLDRAYEHASCRKEMDRVIDGLKTPQNDGKTMEDISKEAKAEEEEKRAKTDARKKARERQQKLLAQFQQKQQAMMTQLMKTENPDPAEREEGEEEKEMIQCVICNQTCPGSTVEEPIGLVTYCVPNSVLAIQKSNLSSEYNRAELINKRRELIMERYEKFSCIRSMDIGVEGGVRVRSCGHYVHSACHVSYLEALKRDRSQQHYIQTRHNEYFCPLCRQISNAVLPLIPVEFRESSDQISLQGYEEDDQIDQLLSRSFYESVPNGSKLKEALQSFLKQCRTCTDLKFQCLGDVKRDEFWQMLLAFYRSVLRHNIEMDLLLNNCEIPQSGSKSVLVPLYHVISWEIRRWEESQKMVARNWRTLIGKEDADDARFERNMRWRPRDVMHFNYETGQGTVFPLGWKHEPETEDESIKPEAPWILHDPSTLLLRIVIVITWKSDMQDVFVAICRKIVKVLLAAPNTLKRENADLDENLKLRVAEFLKFANILFSTVFHQEQNDQSSLLEYSASNKLTSILDEKLELGDRTTRFLREHMNGLPENLKALSPALDVWARPRLIQLPERYDDIVQKYFDEKCQRCRTTPKEGYLCLVCGGFLCFRGSCSCCTSQFTELETHTVDCSAGQGVYMSIQSSMVALVKTRPCKSSLWGSLYLDSHGEEDKNLRRGKPLFLSEDRLKLLEQQWITQTLDNGQRRWYIYAVNLENHPPSIIAL